MNHNSDLEYLKRAVNLKDYILNNYGGQVVFKGGNGDKEYKRIDPCPICGHKNHFDVYTDTNTYCSRSKCCNGGSIIDFFIEKEGMDAKAAIDKLKEMNHLHPERQQKNKSKKNDTETVKTYDFSSIAKRLHKNVWKTDYFIKRGLSAEIIDKYHLGYLEEGYNKALEEYSELQNDIKYQDLFRYFIFIPDEKGEINYFISRIDDELFKKRTKPGEKLLKTLNLKRIAGGVRLLNERYLVNPKLTSEYIFVTEGWADTLSLETLGFSSIALNSTGNANKLVTLIRANKKNLREKVLIICGDSDLAGSEMNHKLIKDLSKTKIEFHILSIPQSITGVKDINDWLVKDRDGLTRYLSEFIEKITLVSERPEYTHYNNAKRVLTSSGDKIRFCQEQSKFYVWDGSTWREDEGYVVQSIIKDDIDQLNNKISSIRDYTEREKLYKYVKIAGAYSNIRGTLEMLKSERSIYINTDKLNRKEMLVNCLNGTLNLETGEISDFQKEDYITKKISVKYDKEEKCPTWINFLHTTFRGDKQIIDFIQRSIGYTLTGSSEEQCFFILYGAGANGKSTFLNAIKGLLGEYAATIQPETITGKAGVAGSARSDIARLHDIRMVVTNEINDEERLNESFIKQITGGENITVRYKYKDEFEFVPSFKLFMATNYKPIIMGVDNGIWRRIILIPFTSTILPEQMDKHLSSKLNKEMSGILNWAIEGCLKWQHEGLDIPSGIQSAIKEYRNEMDFVGNFIEENLVLNKEGTVPVNELSIMFENWCKENGSNGINKRILTRGLTQNGLIQVRNSKQRMWKGVSIKKDI